MREITLIRSDDWAGLYIDGELYTQDHDIYSRDWLELLEQGGNVHATEEWVDGTALEHLYTVGRLPRTLAEYRKGGW